MQFPAFQEDDIQSFVSFANILISEQVSDFYNMHMMVDESLPPIVQKVNRVHHDDEKRHIAMGLRLVGAMYRNLSTKYAPDTLLRIENYLQRYMQFFIESFYNPKAYRDSGLQDPIQLRSALMADPARRKFHDKVLGKASHFFHRNNIIIKLN
jgi:hypothetical protein